MLYAKNTQQFLDTHTVLVLSDKQGLANSATARRIESRYLLVNGARIYRMKVRSLLDTLRLRFPVGLLSLRHTQVNKKIYKHRSVSK